MTFLCYFSSVVPGKWFGTVNCIVLYCTVLYCTGSPELQAGLKLTMWLRMTLNAVALPESTAQTLLRAGEKAAASS